ncbi:MAG: DUF2298 domain-containing protein [Candidatus Microgenomates bacterium]
MNWLAISLNWYFYLFLLGLVFFPLTKKIFNKFSFDLGYPFSKTLAIIFVSYTTYVLGTLKIIPFEREFLFLIIGIFATISFLTLFIKNNQIFKSNNIYPIIVEEILFLMSFLFWAFIRSQEPSIRSLEKFMDFGFINSILRSSYFPPKDMWYTPLSINYYYFGHLTGAFLIKLTNILPSIGYNLILATIFAQGVTLSFSFVANILKLFSSKIKTFTLIIYGLIASFLVNLAGNLHTIYLFTTGYPTDDNVPPLPFWKILSKFNPSSYWYPNATRFIPYTIHEFPSYSYVVADLHGHVFDIPFVLLTLALLSLFFIKVKKNSFTFHQLILNTTFIGFLTAIHYMTNAFDGPIYILLSTLIFFLSFGFSYNFYLSEIILLLSFILFSLPFSLNFSPFVSGIGVNCAPSFLTKIAKFGPFLFEAGNCQISAFWMLFVLWGFFWINFILFLMTKNKQKLFSLNYSITNYLITLFSFGTFLILVPEFFYIKDIYPAHFRANTMFKLGYQAFIMMSIASTITLFQIKNLKNLFFKFSLIIVYFLLFSFVFIYPFFAIPSYYGKLDKIPDLDGASWLNVDYPQNQEIIDWLNKNVNGQPVILEAQGDSYTDYNQISALTGLPTVAGWWVHEWLWRGSSDFVGQRIPDVVNLYESKDILETKNLIKKYNIKYVIISTFEKQKYQNLNEEKFEIIGKKVFQSTNGLGAIYQIN